jgi:hypothetical protein
LFPYGKDGWERATSYLECEPDLCTTGNDLCVMGQQPSVRPQRLVPCSGVACDETPGFGVPVRADAGLRRRLAFRRCVAGATIIIMLDTSPEAARAQGEAHRRMGPSQRFKAACQMSDAFRRVALERICAQHPGFSEAQCRAHLVWELYRVRIDV